MRASWNAPGRGRIRRVSSQIITRKAADVASWNTFGKHSENQSGPGRVKSKELAIEEDAYAILRVTGHNAAAAADSAPGGSWWQEDGTWQQDGTWQEGRWVYEDET